MIPVLAINCAADTGRRKRFDKTTIGLDVHYIDAVDARIGVHVFKPYLSLLRDQFWLSDEIKPGAFACFISHRLAWQRMIDEDIQIALIAEDDGQLSQSGSAISGDVGLTFVNDRANGWAPTGVLDDILASRPSNRARGFGGDGYVLTQGAARALLAQSEIDGVCCGVDWYLAYLGMNTQNLKHIDVKVVSEVKKMWKIFGPRTSLLQAEVSKKPWVLSDKISDSSIKHSHRINIKVFKQQIENA
jgi:GR25 family glycosyltransferase involved in LPS biosynthesis